VIRKSLTNMKGGIATSSNFLSGEPAFIMPFNKYSFFLNEKALEIVEFQGLEWWMIRGSNGIYFFRRNAVSVEKKGVGIV